MKFLKGLGIFAAIAVLIILVLGMVADDKMYLERSVTINAPQTAVFDAVNTLTEWQQWSPWIAKDSTIKNVYSDPAAGEGAYYTWTSENSGAGKMTITKTFNTDSLHSDLEFDGQGTSKVNFHFAPAEAGTQTRWTFYAEVPFPFNGFLLFQDLDATLGKDYEEGLALLKTYVEEKEANKTPEYKVEKVTYPATHFLGIRKEVAIADMGAHIATAMPAVAEAMTQAAVKMESTPSGLVYKWDMENQTTDVAVAIPTTSDKKVDGLTAIDVAESAAFLIDYYGDHKDSEVAHLAMDAHLQAQGITATPSLVIEHYVTDPTTEADPTKWLTKIYYLFDE